MEQPTSAGDVKPSGAPFTAPWDVSFELHLVVSRLLAGIYGSLHPLNLAVAILALLLVGGVSWLLVGETAVSGGQLLAEGGTVGDPGMFWGGGWGDEWGGGWDLWEQTPYAAARLHMLPWWRLSVVRGSDFWRQLLVCGWGLAVWSWAATAICRSTALRMLGVDFNWLDVLRFTNQHFADALFSILIPLLAVVVLSMPLVFAGWLLAGDLLSVLGGLVAALLGWVGLLTGLMLFGLSLSWPLMFPALALEGRDSFESISRAYAYLLQRPVTLLGLAFAGLVVGGMVNYLIEWFCYLSSSSYEWGLAWGANSLNSERLATIVHPQESDASVLQVWTGPWLRTSFAGFGLLNLAAQQVVFWGLAVAIYLLMRRSLDQTPLDEIYQPGQAMLKPLV